jgi:4-methyl-5(b-hydroxyethyl)-thiazole monophosphate biosynthesis
MCMKKVCILLADGFEEVEALTPIDYLRRAGLEVVVTGIEERDVTGSHDIRVDADCTLDELDEEFDALVLPGGKRGAANLAADKEVVALVRKCFSSGRVVAAICAAPAVVLHKAADILKGRRFTGYPGTEADVTGARFSDDRVVVDGNLITARSAGCAGEFAIAIIAALLGPEKAEEIAAQVLLKA